MNKKYILIAVAAVALYFYWKKKQTPPVAVSTIVSPTEKAKNQVS